MGESMNRFIAEEWCRALRSGKYRRIRYQFSDGEGGFCPLGVLHAMFPKATASHFERPETPAVIMDLNDNVAYQTFEGVADFIERNWQRL